MESYEFDVFISHATEDKDDIAEPLARELRRVGLKVWFDKFTLKVGDSLRGSIETGLSRSRFGVVIFSKHFLSKNWPKAELSGLFTREMEGHKVILPVWHNISSSEMKAALPIQADKVALRSSDGVAAVARAIVEAVRPELLEVEKQKQRAIDSSSSFVGTAKEHYPGYSFTFHSGVQCGPQGPGTIGSVKEGQHRVDISISDRSLIKNEPTLTITFSEGGAKKAYELYRTGKTQTWKAGEFTKIGGTIPLMPSGDVSPTQIMTAASNLSHLPSKYMRLEVGTSNPITFPFMEMRLRRAGAHEAEAVVRHPSTPLEVGFIFSVDGSQQVETVFSWDFVGYSCSACEAVINAVDRLRAGDTLRLYDLEANRVAIETPALVDQLADDPFTPELRRVLSIGAEAERRFGVVVRFTNGISDEDAHWRFIPHRGSDTNANFVFDDNPYPGSSGVEPVASPYSGDMRTCLFRAAFAMILSVYLPLSVQATVRAAYQTRPPGGIEWSQEKTAESGIDGAALESLYSEVARKPHHDLKGIVIVRSGPAHRGSSRFPVRPPVQHMTAL